MADLAAMREGLKANLDALSGVQVSAYALSSPSPPCAEVEPARIDYDLAMGRGLDEWNFTVRVYVSANIDKASQIKLDRFIASSGETSVKALLESDKTLDGAADDLRVTGCSGYRVYERGGQPPMLGAEWQVEVIAQGA